jgi:oligosaccharide repeat unit polymerase
MNIDSIPSEVAIKREEKGFLKAAELILYLLVFVAGSLAYELQAISEKRAAVLCLIFLISLTISAWNRFDGGRHPCFLVLCCLIVFCGGRIFGYCLGILDDPLRVDLMTPRPFDLSTGQIGKVLASLCISSLCIYAPCAWNYRCTPPVEVTRTQHYLPYLYAAFVLILPFQVLRNVEYYLFLRSHGYLAFFVDHQGLTSQMPLVIRAASTALLPIYLAIFVFEIRKPALWLVSIVYFGSALLILLTGSRGSVFALALTLWYIAKRKSTARSRLASLFVAALALIIIAALIGHERVRDNGRSSVGSPAQFLVGQGGTLGVLEACVAYRSQFSPYTASYLYHEMESAFVPSDQTHYVRGVRFADDMAVFLSPASYSKGFGSGSAYIAEAYAVGALGGVAVISILIGFGLHLLQLASKSALMLVLVSLVLPEVLWMVRGGLLEWMSTLLRDCLPMAALVLGWTLYREMGTAHSGSLFCRASTYEGNTKSTKVGV